MSDEKRLLESIEAQQRVTLTAIRERHETMLQVLADLDTVVSATSLDVEEIKRCCCPDHQDEQAAGPPPWIRTRRQPEPFADDALGVDQTGWIIAATVATSMVVALLVFWLLTG